MLATRKQQVVFVDKISAKELNLTKEEMETGVEIEGPIIEELSRRHHSHIQEHSK